jgi:hypothetical protein
MSIAVIDYSNAADPLAAMKAAASARRARLYAPPPPKPKAEAPKPAPIPIPKPDYVRDWIALASPESIKPASHRRIIRLVSDAYGLTFNDIVGDRRLAPIVLARQVCFYLMRVCSQMSYPEIARRIGNRDHSTALHGSNKIAELIKTNAELRAVVETLTVRLQAEDAA